MKIKIKKYLSSYYFIRYICVLFFLFSLPIEVNAYPEKLYNEGSRHSILFPRSSSKAKVLNEFIELNIIPNYNNSNDYYANYHIIYHINSDVEQILPLFFIASNLKNSPIVIIVNGKRVQYNSLLNREDFIFKNFPYIKSGGNESVYMMDLDKYENIVNTKELVYFNSYLKKGKNYIHLKYKGNLESNNYGFLKNYTLSYYLFPYKYWESFGSIAVNLKAPNNYKIKYSSLGHPYNNNNNYSWKLKTIENKDLKISLSPKISVFSTILLILKPLGITIILALFLSLIHFYLIKKYRKKSLSRFNPYLILGNIINPVLFYFVYYFSYLIIEWSLGDIALKNYEYIKYPLLYLPLIFILYDITMWFLDMNLKNTLSDITKIN